MTGVTRRRSALYLPASNSRAIEKAASLPCDVVILDLEDSVAPDMKADARLRAIGAAASGGLAPREVVIRVNALDTPWGLDDLEAVASAQCDAVLVPKVRTAADLEPYRASLGGRPIWAMIETARSLFRLEEIAYAPGVAALVFGSNDLAKELGVRSDLSRNAFSATMVQVVAAARASGIAALDGVFNDIDNIDAFSRECREAVGLGFDGKTLIHPKQIEPCHAAFAPSDAELAWATAVRDAFALPENFGKGAIRLEGKMVERLHLDQALAMIARSS